MGIIDVILVIISIGFFVFVIELVRRKHLREKYSLIWIMATGALIVMSFARPLIDYAALKLNIYYPPSLIFMVGIFFLLLLNVSLSVIVSHQTTRIIKLIQEQALLEQRVRKLESDKKLNQKPVDSKK